MQVRHPLPNHIPPDMPIDPYMWLTISNMLTLSLHCLSCFISCSEYIVVLHAIASIMNVCFTHPLFHVSTVLSLCHDFSTCNLPLKWYLHTLLADHASQVFKMIFPSLSLCTKGT